MKKLPVCCPNHLSKELGFWKDGGFKASVIVLGEAPLSCDKYFYHNAGNYLSGLKKYFEPGCSNVDFFQILRERGVLVLDLFSICGFTVNAFRSAHASEKLDHQRDFNDLLGSLAADEIIDCNTLIVPRYKRVRELLFSQPAQFEVKYCSKVLDARLCENERGRQLLSVPAHEALKSLWGLTERDPQK
jgi:hypothetical protein